MKFFFWVFFFFSLVFVIFSWGFVDANFLAVSPKIIRDVISPFGIFFDQNRIVVTGAYVFIVVGLFFSYMHLLRFAKTISSMTLRRWIVAFGIVFACSYPALSYDVFNYILTSRVIYTYKENPYVVQPIEIANEPMLTFTRATNKVALYGPVWIALSWFPHWFGSGSVWLTILGFKLLNMFFFFVVCWLIYKRTYNTTSVVFFALNPLTLIEVIGNAHNDIAMMALAFAGIILARKHHPGTAILSIMVSVFVKGASILLLPLLFIKSIQMTILLSFYALFFLFLFTPVREELYPWYALWWLPFLALINDKHHKTLRLFGMILTFVLLLRYIPSMALGTYDGWVPFIRTVITIVPIGAFAFWAILLIVRRRLLEYTYK